MSALGHKRTFAPQKVMSALPPKATSRATKILSLQPISDDAPAQVFGGQVVYHLCLDRPMTVEKLLAHSIIFHEAARLHGNERAARELRRLAEHCVRAALAMASEVKLNA